MYGPFNDQNFIFVYWKTKSAVKIHILQILLMLEALANINIFSLETNFTSQLSQHKTSFHKSGINSGLVTPITFQSSQNCAV